MTPIIFTPEAQADALDAYGYYESRVPGLGATFREHVGTALAKLQQRPEQCPVVYRGLRRRLVTRFPYAILYRVEASTLVVVAVMHGSRDPRLLARRT